MPCQEKNHGGPPYIYTHCASLICIIMYIFEKKIIKSEGNSNLPWIEYRAGGIRPGVLFRILLESCNFSLKVSLFYLISGCSMVLIGELVHVRVSCIVNICLNLIVLKNIFIRLSVQRK